MTQKERMLNGLPYIPFGEELSDERLRAKEICKKINDSQPSDNETREKLIKSLLGSTKEHFYFEPPVHFDYGSNIEIGDHFYSNYNLTVLDCAKVTVGDYVMIGPNVCITAAGHPIHPKSRSNRWYEYALPVTIGSNVWIGANVVINPNVTIGDNTVIGSGSVVTKDIPPNVVAAGNPCRVIREITDEDRHYYYKDKKFDVDDY